MGRRQWVGDNGRRTRSFRAPKKSSDGREALVERLQRWPAGGKAAFAPAEESGTALEAKLKHFPAVKERRIENEEEGREDHLARRQS
jgi:hypothetical protein